MYDKEEMRRVMSNGNSKTGYETAIRILASLLTAAVIGAWGYAVTRASADDLKIVSEKVEDVEREGIDRERRIERKLSEIKIQIHAMDVRQSEFQGQVREALRIPRSE